MVTLNLAKFHMVATSLHTGKGMDLVEQHFERAVHAGLTVPAVQHESANERLDKLGGRASVVLATTPARDVGWRPNGERAALLSKDLPWRSRGMNMIWKWAVN